MLIHAPNLGWNELPIAAILRDALGDPPFPIRVGNDANLAALGELESGALRGVGHALLIYGNIGIGGAVIVDGAIFPGSDGFAGEIGHMPLRPFDGDALPLRRARLPRDGRRAGGDRPPRRHPGHAQRDLLAAGARGRARAHRRRRGAGRRSTRSPRCSASAWPRPSRSLNPRRVVLAGTLGMLSPWLLPGARAAMELRTTVAPTAVEIVGSELGDEAAIRGGAALVLHSVLNDPTRAPVRSLSH